MAVRKLLPDSTPVTGSRSAMPEPLASFVDILTVSHRVSMILKS